MNFSFINLMYNSLTAHANKVAEQNYNFKHSFLSEFNSASEQAGKLELGKNKTIICFYTNNQVNTKYFINYIYGYKLKELRKVIILSDSLSLIIF